MRYRTDLWYKLFKIKKGVSPWRIQSWSISKAVSIFACCQATRSNRTGKFFNLWLKMTNFEIFIIMGQKLKNLWASDWTWKNSTKIGTARYRSWRFWWKWNSSPKWNWIPKWQRYWSPKWSISTINIKYFSVF